MTSARDEAADDGSGATWLLSAGGPLAEISDAASLAVIPATSAVTSSEQTGNLEGSETPAVANASATGRGDASPTDAAI